MDKWMDSPWFLRFTALFLAMILFFSVQTDEKDSKSKTVGDQVDVIQNVPVEVYYDDENLVVTGVPETVNMTIEGPINIVQTTKSLKDFTLFIDLRTMTMGKHQVRIEHENISDKLQVRLDPATIEVFIEERITKSFPVDPEMNERLLAEGFHLVGVEVEPSTIEVTGAKSIVESISFVKATAASEAGITKSFEQDARVRVLDKDLNKLNVSIEPEHVTVKVEVAENSKEVPITLKPKGTPPAHVAIDSLKTDAKVVTLTGPSKVLDELEELVVDVDVSKVKGQEVLDVPIQKPKGVSSVTPSKIKVNVEATVTGEPDEKEEASAEDVQEEELDEPEKPEEPKELVETVSFDNVQVAVIGLDAKFKCTIVKPEDGLLTVSATAEENVIKTLRKSDISVTVDASEVTDEGEQVFPVTVKGPSDVNWTLSNHEVTLKIELA